jgi:hypothetical protein
MILESILLPGGLHKTRAYKARYLEQTILRYCSRIHEAPLRYPHYDPKESPRYVTTDLADILDSWSLSMHAFSQTIDVPALSCRMRSLRKLIRR